jgi:hypothetical protein
MNVTKHAHLFSCQLGSVPTIEWSPTPEEPLCEYSRAIAMALIVFVADWSDSPEMYLANEDAGVVWLASDEMVELVIEPVIFTGCGPALVQPGLGYRPH